METCKPVQPIWNQLELRNTPPIVKEKSMYALYHDSNPCI